MSGDKKRVSGFMLSTVIYVAPLPFWIRVGYNEDTVALPVCAAATPVSIGGAIMSDDKSESGPKAKPPSKPRHLKPEITCLSCGPLVLDMKGLTVRKGDRIIKLTPKESQLLTAFMSHPGQVITHELLIKEIWHTDYTDDVRMLHVHIRLLRKKIEDEPSRPVLVQTVRRHGYRFIAPESEEI
jgi:DNA-binding winged helix-turn-helix (wHTH) protein